MDFINKNSPKRSHLCLECPCWTWASQNRCVTLTCFERKKEKKKTFLSLVIQNALVISFLWYHHLVLKIHIVHRGQFTATWFSSNLTPINHKPTVYLLQIYSKLSISFILNGVRHPEERWFLTLFRRNASILLGAAWLPEPSKSSAGPITRRHSFKRSSFPER